MMQEVSSLRHLGQGESLRNACKGEARNAPSENVLQRLDDLGTNREDDPERR